MTYLLLTAIALLAFPVALNGIACALIRQARDEGCESETAPLADRLRLFIHESAALACCLGAWPLAPFLGRTEPPPPSDRGVILLIPGCTGDRGSFWLLARRLRRSGWSIAYAEARRWPDRREAALLGLDESLRRARQSAGEKPVLLVAHAAGGLLARDYLRRHADARVGMLLTLGTTHRAATQPLVRWPCLHGPGDAIVRELNDRDPTPDRIETVAIASDSDAWVAPASIAYHPGAFNINVASVGHFGLLVSRRVFRLIVENVAVAEPAPVSSRVVHDKVLT